MATPQIVDHDVDPTLEHVLDTWAPRFIVGGIDYNDFVNMTGRIKVWDDWPRELMSVAAMHETLAADHEAKNQLLSAAQAWFRAAILHHFAICNYVEDQDVHQEGHRRKVECYAKAAPHLLPPAERHEVPFDGLRMAAYLRRPPGVVRPPVVLLVPGTDSVKEEYKTLEDGFLERGVATFSFDGPGQGETWSQSGMIIDYERATSAVIDYLEEQDSVDAERLGVFGMSLGGYLAPRSAAADERIKACAASGGTYDRESAIERSKGNDFNIGRLLHLYKLTDVAELYDVMERSTLQGMAQNIRCPLLVVWGTKEHAPQEHAERIVKEASGPKEFLLLEGGNHVCNNMPYRYRPALWEFMATQL